MPSLLFDVSGFSAPVELGMTFLNSTPSAPIVALNPQYIYTVVILSVIGGGEHDAHR